MQALTMLLGLLAMAQTASAMRCVHSGLCSLGQVKPFVGDISDTKGLKTAAAARSFKNEIIIHMTFSNRILDVKLLLGNWAKLGIEHVLLIGNSNDTCPVVAQQLPHVGCAWYSTPLPIVSPKYRAYHWRYRTLARLVRMGYNVLLADTDIVVFDDPYRYWKSPPFSNFTIINQPEMLSRYEPYKVIDMANAGMLYVQNAHRDGVAAWMLAEVTDRYLRWADDDYALLLSKNSTRDAGIMDQSALNDALTSVATGFPHFLHTMDGFWAATDQTEVIRDTVRQQIKAQWHYDTMPLPKFMHTVGGDKTTPVKWLAMVMPHTEGVWPEEFGGRWYPEVRGNLSLAFMKLLKDDCDGCALWPDVEDNTTITAARAVPTENYMFAPPWLMCGFNARGTNGAWLPNANGTVAQVIGHANYLPPSKTVHKLMWRQWFGQHDWSIAEDHWGTQYVFQANMQQQERTLRDPTPFIEDQPRAPRLLVFFSSHMRLHKLRSMQEYLAVVKGAMQVAALSNRTLVFPAMPCNVSFVGRVDEDGLFQRATRTQARQNEWYPYGTPSDMRCIMTYLTVPQCLVDRRGMLGSEYDHFVQKFGVTYDVEPNRGNTAFFPASSELRTTLSTQDGPASVMVEVAEHDAQAHMDSMAVEQVVFLAHPVKVSGYSLGNWTCLNKATIKDIKELMGRQYNQSSKIHVLQGRVVAGRLTTEGGLAEAPAAPLNLTRTAATMNYAGRLQMPRSDPTTWCKPGAVQAGVGAGKWTTNRRLRWLSRARRQKAA